MKTVRDINQSFWYSNHTPYLTFRKTHSSSIGYKAHSHEELSIGVIKSGMTCLSMDDKSYILKEEDVIFIEPNKVHACNPVNGKPRSYCMLYIDRAWCCKVLTSIYGYEVTQFNCEQLSKEGTFRGRALSEHIDTLFASESPQAVLDLEQILFYLVSSYCSPATVKPHDDELAYQLRHCLLESFAEPPSLSEVAKQLGYSPETLIRSFKRRFGITPRAFVNNYRIQRAKMLLKCGMDIVDVASELGFSDQSQFHRAFVNYTASTPRQFQQGVSIFDNNT